MQFLGFFFFFKHRCQGAKDPSVISPGQEEFTLLATHLSRPHLRDLKNNQPKYENIEITSSRMPFHILPASPTPEGDVSFL